MCGSELILGIDIGTSACKAALFDRGGKLVRQNTQSYNVYHPIEGAAEQDAGEWYAAVIKAIASMLGDGISAADIACVGIDGQSWSCIPVKDGRDIARTPIWMDTLSAPECAELDARYGADRLFTVCGNPTQPGYCTPKYVRMCRLMPDIMRSCDAVLSSNGYIAYRLTGEMSLDHSQGYGWSFFNMAKRDYDYELMAEMGVDSGKMPRVCPSDEIIGKVTRTAAMETGLLEGTPVVAGGLDAACAALGAGVYRPGETQEQGGQAGGMSICVDGPKADPRLILGCHVVPGMYLLQGGTVGGGVMNWMKNGFGCESFRLMDEEAAEVPPGAHGVTCLPYFSGERSPIWDPDAKAVYYGLTYETGRAEMIRAGLESSAYTLRHNLETAYSAGAEVGDMIATGGAASSPLWTQIKADVTGRRIIVPDAPNATVWGAAMVAGVGCGLFASYDEAVRANRVVVRTHTPDVTMTAAYEKPYRRFRELYETLRQFMKANK